MDGNRRVNAWNFSILSVRFCIMGCESKLETRATEIRRVVTHAGCRVLRRSESGRISFVYCGESERVTTRFIEEVCRARASVLSNGGWLRRRILLFVGTFFGYFSDDTFIGLCDDDARENRLWI